MQQLFLMDLAPLGVFDFMKPELCCNASGCKKEHSTGMLKKIMQSDQTLARMLKDIEAQQQVRTAIRYNTVKQQTTAVMMAEMLQKQKSQMTQ